MFKSEDEIVESLLAAKAKSADKPESLARRVSQVFRRKGHGEGISEPLARRLADLARLGVWLETRKVEDETEIALGATKIGGRPDLPSNKAWPVRPAYPDADDRAAAHREIATGRLFGRSSEATAEPSEPISNDLAQLIRIVGEAFPLDFICQINFEEVRHAGPHDQDLPESGVLSVFYDVLEMPWGFNPTDHVGSAFLYHGQGSNALTRHDTPKEFADVERYFPIAPQAGKCHARLMPLPVETAVFDELNLTPDQEETYREWWWDTIDAEGDDDSELNNHLVGGWPVPIQGDMQTECALVAAGQDCGDGRAFGASATAGVRATAKEWVLLIQIGSDEDAGMMWGDVGNLYVWIRREDLVARRFESARLILQCS